MHFYGFLWFFLDFSLILCFFSKKHEENEFFSIKSPKSAMRLKSEMKIMKKTDDFRSNLRENNEGFRAKNSNLIDIFLNNTKKADFFNEKPNDFQKEKPDFFQKEKPDFQKENSNFHNKSQKQQDYNVNLPDNLDNSHNFIYKSKEIPLKNLKNPDFSTLLRSENPKKTFDFATNTSKINRNLGFKPVLPENIENVTNYLHPVENSKENRRDFSLFGQYLLKNTTNTSNNPINANNITNNMTNNHNNHTNITNNHINNDKSYKSFSPFSRENPQNMKKSRSYKMNDDKDEESYKNSRIKEGNHDSTFHNASISVLTRIDFTLKSFASNRPEFFAFPKENMVFYWIFGFLRKIEIFLFFAKIEIFSFFLILLKK